MIELVVKAIIFNIKVFVAHSDRAMRNPPCSNDVTKSIATLRLVWKKMAITFNNILTAFVLLLSALILSAPALIALVSVSFEL